MTHWLKSAEVVSGCWKLATDTSASCLDWRAYCVRARTDACLPASYVGKLTQRQSLDPSNHYFELITGAISFYAPHRVLLLFFSGVSLCNLTPSPSFVIDGAGVTSSPSSGKIGAARAVAASSPASGRKQTAALAYGAARWKTGHKTAGVSCTIAFLNVCR